ncbi:hypothetical protein B0H13DRAFT_2273574, partial [Mycena leptocephala]
MINTLRGVIAPILTSAGHAVNSSLLGAAGADRSNAQVLIGLLRFPQDKKFKVFAPILFPKGEKKMEYIFTSEVVLDLHRVMIHGPSSLVENSHPDTKANRTKYGVEATDHSIALAGILARFLVSADKTFASIGGITKIPWEADYRTYRKLLVSNRNTVFVKHIFKTMNAHVFAGVSKTAENSGAGEEYGDSDDEASSAMERLAFGNFDDPVQPDEDGGSPPAPHTPTQVNVPSAVVPAAGPSRTARFDDRPPQVHEFEQEEEAEERPPAPPKRSSSGRKGGKKTRTTVGKGHIYQPLTHIIESLRGRRAEEERPFQVQNVTIRIPRGTLASVVGRVGVGKPDAEADQGDALHRGQAVVWRGRHVLRADGVDSERDCGELCWFAIKWGISRENVLFGKPFESDRYWRIMEAGRLLPDLRLLPDGDLTEPFKYQSIGTSKAACTGPYMYIERDGPKGSSPLPNSIP